MVYTITEENLVLVMGGHAKANLGHQRHYPIFKTEDGVEWISLNGLVLQRVADLSFANSRREKVKRG